MKRIVLNVNREPRAAPGATCWPPRAPDALWPAGAVRPFAGRVVSFSLRMLHTASAIACRRSVRSGNARSLGRLSGSLRPCCPFGYRQPDFGDARKSEPSNSGRAAQPVSCAACAIVEKAATKRAVFLAARRHPKDEAITLNKCKPQRV